jgi:hypothetical protein
MLSAQETELLLCSGCENGPAMDVEESAFRGRVARDEKVCAVRLPITATCQLLRGTKEEMVTKRERLDVEGLARAAISRALKCEAVSKRLAVGSGGPMHEFDIYAVGAVIGGVTTCTRKTCTGNPNTSACDRACAELLWLSLWPGHESRVHVLTDEPLAKWLVKRFSGAPFSCKIDVYHYDRASDSVAHVGAVGPSNALESTPLRGAA